MKQDKGAQSREGLRVREWGREVTVDVFFFFKQKTAYEIHQ